MARARATPPEPWTVEEFLAWEREQEDRYEYVGGVIRMMVGGTLDHNAIAGNVFSALRAQLPHPRRPTGGEKWPSIRI